MDEPSTSRRADWDMGRVLMAGREEKLNARGLSYVPFLFSFFKPNLCFQGRVWTSPALRRHPAIVCFTASTSCFRLKGFGRKLNSSPSGRFFLKASSA